MPSDPTQPPLDAANPEPAPAAPGPAADPAQPCAQPAAQPEPAKRRDPHAAIRARIRALQRAQAGRDGAAAAPPPGTVPPVAKPRRRGKPGGIVLRDVSATGWTADKQRAFLEHLATHGCVNHAAAHVGLSKQSAYALRHRGGRTMFALAWEVAVRSARKALLDEALERAFTGRAAPVWYRGEQVGERIVHNDRLLMHLLAHKLEPIDSAYDEATLAQAWPALLAQVDAEVPFDARTMRDRDHLQNGNDEER